MEFVSSIAGPIELPQLSWTRPSEPEDASGSASEGSWFPSRSSNSQASAADDAAAGGGFFPSWLSSDLTSRGRGSAEASDGWPSWLGWGTAPSGARSFSSGSGGRLLPMEISLGSVSASRAASLVTGGAIGGDGGEDAEWGTVGEPCPLCAGLSLKERVVGFGISLAVGSFLSFAAFASWKHILVGRPERFAIMYTLGNVFNLSSTLFLVGPASQCKRMWVRTRRAATAVYLAALISTLLCVWIKWHAYGLANVGAFLTFASVGIQSAALLWYGLSYVPFGRSMFARAAKGARDWVFN